jgi:hypothetical protein
MTAYDTNAYTEDTRRPEEIEHDLDRSRAEVSSTIDAIQSKLTPGQMMDQAFAYARTSLPADFGANLSNTIRENPVPVALVGIGLAWLMASGQRTEGYLRSRSRYQEDSEYQGLSGDSGDSKLHRAASTISEKGSALKDRASETAQNIKDKASDLGHRISDSASSVTDRARNMTHQMGELGHRSQEQYQRAKESAGRMMEEQPLVVGAIGIAVGTLLGAILPSTRREDEMMGRTRDDMLDKAKEIASEQADRVKESAKHVAQVAGDEAKAVASDVSSSVQKSREEATPGQHGYH